MRTDQLDRLAGTVILVAGRSGVDIARERLRELRTTLGLTQAQLAGEVGVYASDISSYETGKARPDPATLRRLADALDVEPGALLDPDAPLTLKAMRIRSGLTQARLAAACGVSRSTYAAIERGDTQLTRDLAGRIAAALAEVGARTSAQAVVDAAGTVAPRTEYLVLPEHLVDQLYRRRRPGEKLTDTLARLLDRLDELEAATGRD